MLPDARSESGSKSAKGESVKDIVISNTAQCREALEQQQTSTIYLVAGGKKIRVRQSCLGLVLRNVPDKSIWNLSTDWK